MHLLVAQLLPKCTSGQRGLFLVLAPSFSGSSWHSNNGTLLVPVVLRHVHAHETAKTVWYQVHLLRVYLPADAELTPLSSLPTLPRVKRILILE
jgi:hypothetical protein